MTTPKPRLQVIAEPLLISIAEASAMTGYGETKIRQFIAAGEWPVVRDGGDIRIYLAGLQEWISARVEGGLGLAKTSQRLGNETGARGGTRGLAGKGRR
jgi:excisionase family DNA binding protein